MVEKASIVYVSVGSNLEPEKNIEQALIKLNKLIPVKRISTHYRTEPVGNKSQPYYINGVWQLETTLAPDALKFNILREIERILGRERSEDKDASRTIDLDILIYADQVIAEADLMIPDPDLNTRDFLVIPLYELAPKMVIPGSNTPLAKLKDTFKNSKIEPLKQYTEELRRRIRT